VLGVPSSLSRWISFSATKWPVWPLRPLKTCEWKSQVLQIVLVVSSNTQTYRRICALSQLLQLLETTGVSLVHGFYPASSTKRSYADVTVGSLAGERSYSKGADVGWV